MTVARRTAALAAGAVVADALPLLASVGPLRRRITPGLAGITAGPHIALTFDDGPDPRSTPRFLDLLARHDRTATFFLLGAFVAENAGLVREMAAAGHELAVHGWDHRCVALKRPGRLAGELRRTADLLEGLTGEAVCCYRTPYGVTTTEALLAAGSTGLRPVLWSAWGRDWERGATPQRIVRSIDRTLAPGGTLLLHDTDRTAAPGSWRRTLAATEVLLERWHADGSDVGPLRDH